MQFLVYAAQAVTVKVKQEMIVRVARMDDRLLLLLPSPWNDTDLLEAVMEVVVEMWLTSGEIV